MLTAVVKSGNSVTLIVLMVSQPPVADAIVSITEPGALNTCPSKLYGNPLAHTSRLTVVVNSGSSVTLIALTVSQAPVVDATVSITEPGALNKWPSKIYGNPL